MNKDGVNIYEREKLYEEVWNAPVTHVAKMYGVSDVAIHKICKSMNIPTPPNGYWTKIKYGKEVKKSPLPPVGNNQNKKYGINPNNGTFIKDDPMSFLNIKEHENLCTVAQSLKIVDKDSLCEEICEHQKIVDKWNKNNASIEGLKCSYTEYKYRHSVYNGKGYDRPPILAGAISENGLIRAYKILDALIEGIKQLEYSVNNDMSFQIRGEKVKFYIYEKQSYFEHIVTSEEIEKLAKYEKDIKRNRRATKPYIPSDDYLFNGKLLFNTRKVTYIQDTDEILIENRLSDMLIQLVQQSEVIKKERLEKEEKERREKEEWRQRNLPAITFNEEVNQLTVLLQEAQDYETAQRIRNFVKQVQFMDTDHEKSEWVEWASAKADWYDPTINKNDLQFGERKHDEEPIPNKKTIYRW